MPIIFPVPSFYCRISNFSEITSFLLLLLAVGGRAQNVYHCLDPSSSLSCSSCVFSAFPLGVLFPCRYYSFQLCLCYKHFLSYRMTILLALTILKSNILLPSDLWFYISDMFCSLFVQHAFTLFSLIVDRLLILPRKHFLLMPAAFYFTRLKCKPNNIILAMHNFNYLSA